MKLIDFLTILDKHYKNISSIEYQGNNFRDRGKDKNKVYFGNESSSIRYEAEYVSQNLLIVYYQGKVDKVIPIQ